MKKPKCAQCGKELSGKEEDKIYLPFCSKRCKMIDLGLWLGEKYAVADSTPVHSKKNDDDE